MSEGELHIRDVVYPVVISQDGYLCLAPAQMDEIRQMIHDEVSKYHEFDASIEAEFEELQEEKQRLEKRIAELEAELNKIKGE